MYNLNIRFTGSLHNTEIEKQIEETAKELGGEWWSSGLALEDDVRHIDFEFSTRAQAVKAGKKIRDKFRISTKVSTMSDD
ncbi:hypothetical protein LCGC14_3005910 [marine sediment metagenome]|uniref:Uncharacterized protein n=1 Tax=marine sediment metagenome TaxID=412755 RepID=A0A0F8WZI4_9ZZZZ